jgi:ketosteroid isomerase-like protein
MVKSIYDGWGRGDTVSFGNSLAENFELFVPEYLPWGGRFTKQQYVDLLPKVASILDFPGMTHDSLTAEGSHVVAFIVIGVRGTDKSIMISEHWDIVDGKATKLRVAYYDPKALLDKLGEHAVA